MTRRRRPHGPDCRHCPRVRLLGHDFAVWRHSWELTRERATAGYADELSRFAYTHNPAPTFRDYLVAMTGSGWPMSGSAPKGRRWVA
jgi:hypothetical protein